MTENIETISENTELEVTNEKTTEKKKTSFFKKMKDPKYTKYKVILAFVLACTIGGLGYYVFSSFNWSADKICRALSNEVATISVVTIDDSEQKNTSYFTDSVIKKEVAYTGIIEVFENKAEAILKKDYYELYDKEMKKVFNDDLLGPELSKTYATGTWKMYVNGNTLIRFSPHYSEYQIKQINKKFNQVMERIYQTEKNIPTADQQKQIQKNYKKQVENEVQLEKASLISSLEATLITFKAEVENEETAFDRLLEIKDQVEIYKVLAELSDKALEIQNAVEDKIASKVTEIDHILDEALNTYSRDKIDEAKNAIALLTHDIFNEYKDPWNKRIEQILYQIKEKEIQDYKDSCSKYSYYEIDDSYKGKRAYFYGKIYRVTTNNNGRITLIVNTEPQYLLGSIAYWTNSVYVDMDKDIMLSYDQGDLIELWGTLEGMVVNEQVFGDAKSYPNFYCKYASK